MPTRDGAAVTIPHGYAQVRQVYGALQFDAAGHVTAEWERTHLRSITLPYRMAQHAVPGSETITRLYCHRLIADPLCAALGAILDAGLHLRDCGDVRYDGLYAFGGCWNVRAVRGHPGAWSLHSWGIAVDFNPRENPLGALVSRQHPFVVAAFQQVGFTWGMGFARRDPMHFQLADGC